MEEGDAGGGGRREGGEERRGCLDVYTSTYARAVCTLGSTQYAHSATHTHTRMSEDSRMAAVGSMLSVAFRLRVRLCHNGLELPLPQLPTNEAEM